MKGKEMKADNRHMEDNKRETRLKRKERIQRIRPYIKQLFYKNKLNFCLRVFCGLAGAAANLLISWIMQQLIDVAAGVNSRFTLGELAIITLLVFIGLGFTMLISYYAGPRFFSRAMKQYKDYAFSKISGKGIAAFQKENTSDYLSALTNDAASIEINYLESLISLPENVLMFAGAFVMMICYSPLLTLIGILLSLLPVLVSVLAGGRLEVKEKKVSDQNTSFLAQLKDVLNGFPVIKSFKAEKEIGRLFEESNGILEQAKKKRRETFVIIENAASGAGFCAQFGVFLIGTYMAIKGGNVTAGVVMVFVNLMNFVISPIAQVPKLLANCRAALGLIDKLAEALDTNSASQGEPVEQKLREAITVENVSFGYEEGEPVLTNISCKFESGKSYAVVGGSGSGKSTLLSLLMGSYGSYLGEICYDRKELKGIQKESLYDLVSIAQQNVFVFNSSIRDNITMYRDFDREKLALAIRNSGLEALIDTHGEEYPCGENGNALSGGERQRISIARCLLRETPVLLVDEATAALDAATAFAVTDSILSLEGLTRILVTHRLEETLLKRFDGILVLKNGQIAEEGTFEELMEKKAYFYSLFTVSQ